MRILVVEDKELYRASARKTLVGHEVTIVGFFDEAMELLPLRDEGEEPEAATYVPAFDAVLIDMMMPMIQKKTFPGPFQPCVAVPYGFIIALRAALCDVKYVAMVTVGEAAGYGWPSSKTVIDGAKVALTHAPFMEVGNSYDWGLVLRDLTAD